MSVRGVPCTCPARTTSPLPAMPRCRGPGKSRNLLKRPRKSVEGAVDFEPQCVRAQKGAETLCKYLFFYRDGVSLENKNWALLPGRCPFS